jgi:hypothetical protein
MHTGLSVLTFILETSLSNTFVQTYLFFSLIPTEDLHILIMCCFSLHHSETLFNPSMFCKVRFSCFCLSKSTVPVTWQKCVTMHQKAMINLKRHFCISCGTVQGINYHISIFSQHESEKKLEFALLIISWGFVNTLNKQELISDDPQEAKFLGHMNIIVE